jgi:thiol-disulfide isomerase/thioredoxin
MKPRTRSVLAAITLFSGIVHAVDAAAENAGVRFRPLSFEAACQAASDEKKIVFIDFFTTWCGPCKELDKTTWLDAAVGSLLRDKAVALKIDAEKEGKDLARRYKINAYPTLLLLQPDGTELDRIVGYRPADKFMAEFSAGLAGRTAIMRARETVSAAGASTRDAVKARYELGQALARQGAESEALREYLWCYDVGMVQEASYAGVRGSFLLSSIKQLGRTHPPALVALRERRDEAERRMLGGAEDRRAAMDFASLNGALDENDRTLAVFDALPPGDARRQGMLARVFDLLVAAKRYQDAAVAVPLAQMRTQLERNLESMERMSKLPRPAGQANPFSNYVVSTTLKHIEVLAGSGQLDGARELAVQALKIDTSDDTRQRLRAAVERAGQPVLAGELAGP